MREMDAKHVGVKAADLDVAGMKEQTLRGDSPKK